MNLEHRSGWALGALAALAVGVGTAAKAGPISRCERDLPSSPSVQLRVGSPLGADGRATRAPSCAEIAHAIPLIYEAEQAVGRVPSLLRPALLSIELAPELPAGAPRIRRIETDAATGVLLIDGATRTLEPSVWLHEIAHVRMRGERPRALLARRLVAVLEEGFADYFAATFGGSPKLGPRRGGRDLLSARSGEWASLALPGFDPHRLGSDLAARLYRLEPNPGPLVEDAVGCLDGKSALVQDADTPRAVLEAVIAECPERSRRRLSDLLIEWVPAEIREGGS